MGHLKTLAYEAIKSSVGQLSPSDLVEEACSVSCNIFTSRQGLLREMLPNFSRMIPSRYPEWTRIYAGQLSSALDRDQDANFAFRENVSAFFSGRLPHCKEIITSTLLVLLNLPICSDESEDDRDCSPILRVSPAWPDGTKEALRMSLDNGVFDDLKFSISCGPELTLRQVYFPSALMGDTSKWEFSFASGFSLLTSVINFHIHLHPFHTD